MTTTPVNPFVDFTSKHLYDNAIKSPTFVVLAHRLANTTDISEWTVRFWDEHSPGNYYNRTFGFEIELAYGVLRVDFCVRQSTVWDASIGKYVGSANFGYSNIALVLPTVPIRTTWYDGKIINTDSRSRSILNGAKTAEDFGISDGKFAKKLNSAAKALSKAIDEIEAENPADARSIMEYVLSRVKVCLANKDALISVYQSLAMSGHFNAKQVEMLRHVFKDADLL